ncbi:MAG: radical SAM protein [bacterium]|nr:radical SAM protein [bacterium]
MEPGVDSQRPRLPIVGRGAAARPGRKSEETDPQRKSRPHVYWYLSFRCNLTCAHCWVQSSPHVDTSDDLSTREAMRVIEQMVELNAGTCILTGGEALIRRDTLEIMEALGESGIAMVLETNGLAFSQRFAELARRLQEMGKLRLSISLDGGTAQTHDRLRGEGAFRRTHKGLLFLADNGVRFAVQCVLNNGNIHTVPRLYDLATRLHPHLSTLGFVLLNPIGRGESLARELGAGFEDLSRVLVLIRENQPKFAGRTVIKAPPAAIPPEFLDMVFKGEDVTTQVTCRFPLLAVLPNGDITICALSRDNDELFFGNVRDTRLKQVWEKARLDELRSRYLTADELTGICGDCVWKHLCKGSCRAWAYEDGSSFDAPFPLCATLHEAGEFPRAYRLSARAEALRKATPVALGKEGCRGG